MRFLETGPHNKGDHRVADRQTDCRLLDRRALLAAAGASGITLLAGPSLARVPKPPSLERRLRFYNVHTEERLDVAYWRRGRYHGGALFDIDYILRDWRTGDIVRIDRKLLDLLNDLHTQFASEAPFHVISGYRTAQTNAMLMNTSAAVAKNSFHVRAQAIDIYLPDVRLRDLQRAAVASKGGGVGYYPRSNFLHLDTGPVRRW